MAGAGPNTQVVMNEEKIDVQNVSLEEKETSEKEEEGMFLFRPPLEWTLRYGRHSFPHMMNTTKYIRSPGIVIAF